jgi:signal transduction histidine kinase
VAYQPPDNLPPPVEAVSDLAQAYSALRERVRRTEDEIARVSSLLSHDLRAQLRSVDAFREFVLEDAAECLDPESRENLERIGQSVQSLDHLVERVVLLARLPRQPLRLEVAPASAVVEPAVTRLRQAFPSADVRVDASEPEAPVRVDAARAVEALYQLLENATIFQPQGASPPAVVEVRQGREARGAVTLRVVDHGLGIDAGDFERIFRVGTRLHGPRTYPGAGVGLYLARRLLEGWAAGPVLVASAPGAGSTFEMTLPAG